MLICKLYGIFVSPLKGHYTAVVQTSVVCSQVPSTGVTTTVGSNLVSSQCGGGIYDLSSLSGRDLVSPPLYDALSTSTYNFYLRPCGALAVDPCGGGSSLCQQDTSINHAENGRLLTRTLATWQPATYPVVWQYAGPGTVVGMFQDGGVCDNSNRLVNLTFTCNPSAVTPSIVALIELPECVYAITVQTNLTCGAAFAGISAVSVLGDPQFSGLLGQSFQVHGIDGQVYSIISDSTGVLVNARFVFLSEGRCTAALVASNTMCWSHPGSYLDRLYLRSAAGHEVHLFAGGAVEGLAAVLVDGRNISIPDAPVELSVDDVRVSRTSSHSVQVSVGNYELLVTNSDRFINIAQLSIKHWSNLGKHSAHGLLGQTWHRPRADRQGVEVAHIEGSVDDYAEANNRLEGSSFGYKME